MAKIVESRELLFKVPGGVISAQEWQQTPNPTRKVILLPGRQDSSNSFRSLVPLLPREWLMVAMEFPGDGLSTRKPPGAAYHMTDRLLDLKRVLKQLGWTRFTIIGHSMGAGLGQVYAALFPEEVEALVSLDVLKQMSENPANTVQGLRKAYATLETYNEDVEEESFAKEKAADWYFEKNVQQIATMKNADLISREALAVILDRNIRQLHGDQYVLRRDPRIAFPPIVRTSADQHREIYNAIKTDHLFIRNLKSTAWEPALEKEFIEIYNKNCSRFVYKEVDAMHHAHLDHPELVAPIITEFLGSSVA
ncbi:putative Serine hydrolase-like protein [Hypsibius exemplaris]|uniref:Serine hydrolase-like protein n=1 Tax=Hypsibius exemplaris TaxID=2072580 RepID=A0A1W0WT19_HYPEX|nr:putative Serine hydrolase-like protein [Hypsibius exemplaris]